VLTAIVFFLAATGAIAGALAVVMLRNPFYAVLALVAHLFSLAVLFLLLYAQFLAAAQLIVYAGAVMVLYVFVVSYVGGADEPEVSGTPLGRSVSIVASLSLLAVLAVAIAGSSLKLLTTDGPRVTGTEFGTPEQIGELLLTKYLLPFELASFLLTVVAVAAVVLARRRRGLEELADDTPMLGEGLSRK
jgi:NADH-quinone oxidoreductase subunit J